MKVSSQQAKDNDGALKKCRHLMKWMKIFTQLGTVMGLIYNNCCFSKSVQSYRASCLDFLMGMLSPSSESRHPLGNSPACIYVGEMGYNYVYDAIKSFWPKPSLPTVCL